MPWNNSVIDSEILAVHAALVPTGPHGEVVLFGGDEHWSAQQESAPGHRYRKTRLYDVATHALVPVAIPSPDTDVFCSHHAFTGDGRLLIAGGTRMWPVADHHAHGLDFLGHERCWLYNPRQRTWSEAARLNRNPDQPDEDGSGGRWYPGLLTLPDGSVLATFGHPNQADVRHRNTLPERYLPAGNVWVNLPREMAYPLAPGGGVRYLFYARAFTLPDGSVFFATPMPVRFETVAEGTGPYFSTRYDPTTGEYLAPEITPPPLAGYTDWSRPAVLLPLLPESGYRPQVLFCGARGVVGGVERSAYRIDLGAAAPAWQPTADRAPGIAGRDRIHGNAVLLPTGKVCLVGGVHQVDPEDVVLQAETYDPLIDWNSGGFDPQGAWSVDGDDAAHGRNYHSTALLLPNGKVWVAGGNDNGSSGDPDVVGVKSIELYEPDYVAVGGRTVVQAAPRVLSYGETFEVQVDRPATQVARIALLRCSSVTHATNNDQRYVGLVISSRDGNTLTAVSPPNGGVAPPGPYMLWVIGTDGHPCQLAPFVRLAHLSCGIVTDHSTFSAEQVESLGGGGTATFNHAVYAYFDGFAHHELSGSPRWALSWDDDGQPISTDDVVLLPQARWLETGTENPDVPQRITYPFHVRFRNMNVFGTFSDLRRMRLTITLGHHTCSETLDLTHHPNPYMLDVDPTVQNPHWLSTDVRVFKVLEGETRFGDVTQGGSPHAFIRAVLDRFNAIGGGPAHPFFTINPDQAASAIAISSRIGGTRVFNYAIAQVRYRATVTTASRVKVFFRSFNAAATGLHYDAGGTYRHSAAGAGTVPLLGSAGGEVVSIPFFTAPRVETRTGEPGAASMTTQPLADGYDVRDIPPGPGERTAYFGCWLDVNQESPARFPISLPAGNANGPWPVASCRTIQELVRSRHQCLVAEVFLEADPTTAGETPGSSDNLAQRNLAWLPSDNPGGVDSRTVVHTFEVRPSAAPLPLPGAAPKQDPTGHASTHLAFPHRKPRHGGPDQLLFRWRNLPRESEVTLYFSDVDAYELERLCAFRRSPAGFAALSRHAVRFHLADVSWLPLPGGRELPIPLLLQIRLPEGIVEGQEFRVSVHQVDGASGRVTGAIEFGIPVSKAPLIVEEETRTLSVMRHIAVSIPPENRWYPVFQRYLHAQAGRVDALGGDASIVHGNPDGSGTPYTAEPGARPHGGPCWPGWLVAVVLALGLVLAGFARTPVVLAVIATAALTLGAAAVAWWRRICCGRALRCALLDHLTLGAGAAAGGLALAALGGFLVSPAAAVTAALLTALLLAASFVLGCRGECCDGCGCGCECGGRRTDAPPSPDHTGSRR